MSSDSALETLWKHTLDHWEDEAAHRAFLEHCRHHDLLVEAAVRYRGMKGDHARGPVAEKKLAAIAVLAMAKLESARSPERRKQGHFLSYVLIALFIAGTIGLLAYLGPLR
ncbi:MAG TPA: hypothetical protein VGK73_02540 [Polyangiaceae bacterium]